MVARSFPPGDAGVFRKFHFEEEYKLPGKVLF